MHIITKISDLRTWHQSIQGKLAFIPTMGNLHQGHMKLVEEAKKRAPNVVVSIFVNRLQFGQGEDFEAYPRTLEADAAKLSAAGVSVLFAPDDLELYPHVRQDYEVVPPSIQNELCGAYRPGHFKGVATVVCKLLNIVQPDFACFGKKDFQQLHIIKAMVADLNIPVEIIAVDTGRAESGLALSSRNGYLSASELQEAPYFYQVLTQMKNAILSGERDFTNLEQQAVAQLSSHNWVVDYVEVRQAQTLQIARPEDHELVILAAARLGKTRLIDNVTLCLANE